MLYFNIFVLIDFGRNFLSIKKFPQPFIMMAFNRFRGRRWSPYFAKSSSLSASLCICAFAYQCVYLCDLSLSLYVRLYIFSRFWIYRLKSLYLSACLCLSLSGNVSLCLSLSLSVHAFLCVLCIIRSSSFILRQKRYRTPAADTAATWVLVTKWSECKLIT